MKHLISLSLKYIRRQKLRTSLTVMCIVLAVFILNVFAVAGSSLLASLRETEILNNGAWEVDLGGFVTKPETANGRTTEEMEQLVREHAAISDYLFTRNGYLSTAVAMERNPANAIAFMELQVDDCAPQRMTELQFYQAEGNGTLTGSVGSSIASFATTLKGNEVFLPASVQSQGYKVGDTVMLRGSIVYAVLDESVPQVQEILKIMEEKNADPDEHYYMINDGTRRGTEPPEEIRGARRPIHPTNLMTLMTTLLGDYTLEDIDFRETLRSEVVELPVTIAGFYDADPYSMYRQTSVLMSRECMDFAEAMYMAAEPLTEQWQEDYLTADDETAGFGGTEMLSYDTNAGWVACISEKIPFSDGLTMLLTSAGAKDPELVEYYFPAGSLNGTLLMTKFRYMNAATDIMLLFASFSLMLILIWAFSRFVIDNAFEISVQERSVQFAALRLMGASKRQLLAVVFTEATVYTLICVPLGLGAALGLTAVILQVMHNAGLSTVIFEVQPVLQCVTVFLAVIAIYISAYTSAIYASRKLTLTEAMQFGKPQMPKKNKNVQSKLNVSARGFIYRYGWKNIMRTKRRFLISSIALVLGVWLFTFCGFVVLSMAGELIYTMNRENDDWYKMPDFYIEGSGAAAYDALHSYLKDNSDFESYVITAGDWSDMEDACAEQLDALPMIEAARFTWVPVIDQAAYERDLADLTGISYKAWVDSKQAFLTQSPYPDGNMDVNGDPIEPLPAKYASAAEVFGDLEPVVTMMEGKESVPVMGVMVLPEAVYSSYMRWSGCGLLLPVENYYQYFNDMIVSADVRANPAVGYEDLMHSLTDMAHENGLEIYNSYAGGTGLIKILIAAMIALVIFLGSIWLAGVLSMINTLHTNVLNRRNELRMLRAVGCSTKQMKKMLVMEGMLFSSVSTAIGIGLGALLVYLADGGAEGADTIGIGVYVVLFSAAMFAINLLISALCAKPGLKSLKNEVR